MVRRTYDRFSWARAPDERTPRRGGSRLRMRSTLRKRPGDAVLRTQRLGAYAPGRLRGAADLLGGPLLSKWLLPRRCRRPVVAGGSPTENADRRVFFSLGDNVSVPTGMQTRNERPRTTWMAPEAGGGVCVRVAAVECAQCWCRSAASI